MEFGFRLYLQNEIISVYASELDAVTIGADVIYRTSVRERNVEWRFEKHPKGTNISLKVTGSQKLGIKRIDSLFFEVEAPCVTDRVLFFGNKMLNCTHRYACELGENREYAADCTGLFPNLAGRGMALAAVAPFTNEVGAGVKKRGDRYEYFVKTEYTEGMLEDTELITEKAFLAESITIDELYDCYREMLPKSSFSMPRLTGWNTWDYYLNDVRPEDIFENIEALQKTSFADKLNYIVIDDGWQKEWGEWVENDKFACGLQEVSERIRKCGFLPGIWAAPLLMNDKCAAFSERMDWFCRDGKGELIRSAENSCVIDPTRPEAKEFILEVYRRLYRYGYRLFKIDYVSPLLAAKAFFDHSASAYSALRSLICDIQTATGPDAVILGCSLPVQCGADIAPSMRIGVDIHNHFTHVKWIAEMLAWTWMYNTKVTRIDPDFLIVRGVETADEPLKWVGEPNYTAEKRFCDMTGSDIFRTRWRQGDQFSAVEAETWAYLTAICGGNLFLSDRMAALNDRGIAIIKRAMELAQEECRPVYLESDVRLPSLWVSNGAILLVNWEDIPVTRTVEYADGGLKSDKPHVLKDGKLTVTLLPHECFAAQKC